MKTKTIPIVLFLLFTLPSAAQKNEATNFAVKNPDKTFVGAVLEYKSVNADVHRFVNLTVPEPITISFSIPIKSKTIVPSYENMMKLVRESVIASGKIEANQSFSYQLQQINSYDLLMWYFGQTVNTETFFGIPLNAKPRKTTAIVGMTQTFFSIGMDFPDDGKLHDKDPEVTRKADQLVYIITLSFGRKVTAVVEADIPFSTLKTAIEEALGSDGKPISPKSSAVLANADIRIMTLGDAAIPELKPDNPFASVMEYFQKPVTAEDFGVPIQFTAAYIKGNSVFSNEY